MDECVTMRNWVDKLTKEGKRGEREKGMEGRRVEGNSQIPSQIL